MAKPLPKHAPFCSCAECTHAALHPNVPQVSPPADDDDDVICSITVGGEEADWEREAREYHERGGGPDIEPDPDSKSGAV